MLNSSILFISKLYIEKSQIPSLFLQMEDGSSRHSSRARSSEEPHIGKYRLMKTIGKGNFAKVKLAKHLPTGREVRKRSSQLVNDCSSNNNSVYFVNNFFKQVSVFFPSKLC